MTAVAGSASGDRGRLLVVSGPSGVGKSTVVRALLARVPQAWLSVSATTRPARPGEIGDVGDFVNEFAAGGFGAVIGLAGSGDFGRRARGPADHHHAGRVAGKEGLGQLPTNAAQPPADEITAAGFER